MLTKEEAKNMTKYFREMMATIDDRATGIQMLNIGK